MSDAISGIIGGLTSIGATSANAVLAAQTRKWMEHMRDTQYQATTKDLRRANLNPLLALGGGPSTAGVGTPPTAHVEDPMTGIQAGLSAGRQLQMMRSEIEEARARSRAATTDAEIKAKFGPEQARAGISALYGQWYRDNASIDLMRQQAEESKARTVREGVNSALLRAQVPQAEADARFYSTETGQNLRAVQRVFESLPLLRGALQSGARR